MSQPLHAKYRTVKLTDATSRASLLDRFRAMANPTVGLLLRASTDVKDTEQSVTAQDARWTRHAEEQGWNLPREYVWSDNKASASRYAKKARGGFAAALDAISTGKINCLIMKEMSRSTRQNREWVDLFDACREHDVILCVGGQLYDLNIVEHSMALGLSAVVAVGESDRTSSRVDEGRREAVLAGKPMGKPAYGYLRRYSHTGALVDVVEHPEEGPVVRRVFCMRSHQGMGRYTIAAELNRGGVPSPAESQRTAPRPEGEAPSLWWAASVGSLLTNPRYIGLYVWRGQVVEGVTPMWPPLITEGGECEFCGRSMAGTWRAAQQTGVGVDYEVRSSIATFTTGILECGPCGAPMRRTSPKRGRPRAICQGVPGGVTGCSGIGVEMAETMIRALVIAALSDPRLGDWFGFGEEERASAARAAGEIEEAESEIRALAGRVEAGEVSLMLAGAEERRLRAHIAELEPRAQVRIPHPLVEEVAGPDPAAVGAAFDSLDLVRQRDVVRALLQPGKRIRVRRLERAKHRVGDPYRSLEVPWLGA